MKTELPKVSEVRRVLRDLAFDARKPGAMQPIIDVGNQDYYLARAAEMALHAKSLPSGDVKRANIENAITLLSLALMPEIKFDGTIGS